MHTSRFCSFLLDKAENRICIILLNIVKNNKRLFFLLDFFKTWHQYIKKYFYFLPILHYLHLSGFSLKSLKSKRVFES